MSRIVHATLALAFLAGCVEETAVQPTTPKHPRVAATASATATETARPEPPPPPPLPQKLAELGTGSFELASGPTGDPKRTIRAAFVAGDPIYARLTVARSLGLRGSDVTLDVVADWKSTDGRQNTCSTTIDGTTKGGARALVATSFDVSIVPIPGATEAEVPIACRDRIRADWTHGKLGVATLRIRLVATLNGRSTDVALATVPLAGNDEAASRTRWDALDAAADAEERRLASQRRMPASLMPSLDAAAMVAVRERIEDEHITEFTPLRVVMTERDYTLERDERTSIVLRRDIMGLVAFRKPDATCILETVELTQEFDGVRYRRLVADFPTKPSGPALPCANVGP